MQEDGGHGAQSNCEIASRWEHHDTTAGLTSPIVSGVDEKAVVSSICNARIGEGGGGLSTSRAQRNRTTRDPFTLVSSIREHVVARPMREPL